MTPVELRTLADKLDESAEFSAEDVTPLVAAAGALRNAADSIGALIDERRRLGSEWDKRGADRLAEEVAILIERKVLDQRSPAADALLDYRDPDSPRRTRPKVVCLCGSTRFWQQFRDEGLRLTLEGAIVLSIGIAALDSMTFAHASDEDGRAIKRRLDELHKRKIDLADEILVLNVGGYVGDSTASEMAYAARHGKTIRFLEPERSAEAEHKAGLALARMVEAEGAR